MSEAVASATTESPAETPAPIAPKPLTKRELVLKYYAAKTREEKAALWEKHPEIRETFSQGNHHVEPKTPAAVPASQ